MTPSCRSDTPVSTIVMRILAISHSRVWPIRSGSAIRRAMILEALASFGRVDLLYAGDVAGWGADVPAASPVSGVSEVVVRRVRPSLARRLAWLVKPDVPIQVLEWERRGATATTERYDLVWYFRAVAYGLTCGLRGRKVIVDLDDLEDAKLRLKYGVARVRSPMVRRLAQRRNAVAWRRYQRYLSDRVDAVTVSNEADRIAFGRANCHWVPNGFPAVPRAHRDRRSTTLLLVGQFEYEPNCDAAEHFVQNVLPLVRARLPGVTLRLVGPPSPRVHRLAGDGVQVIGEVDDLGPEYDRAAVAISPVRFGSGTRIKIIEAFARGVPVVSTSVGAAGLGADNGKHILLADDPAAFADACVMLLRNPETASRLAQNAAEFYEHHFGQDMVTGAVANVLRFVGLI